MTQETAKYGEDVEQLRVRFLEFRKAHAVRSRLPEELWAAAARLAGRDGIEATARVLEVDRPSLQKWTDRFEPRTQTKPPNVPVRRGTKRAHAVPTFVELLAETTTATSCVVEVESPKGGKLRLELKTIRANELAELIRAFVA